MDANRSHSPRPGSEVTPTRGRVLAVDVGHVRVGLAVCDPDRLLASPLVTIGVPAGGSAIDVAGAVTAVVTDESAVEVVVGLPLSLSGGHGAAADGATGFADVLSRLIAPVPVRLVDERFTTTTAHRELAESGRSSRRRRAVIDQAAAVVLLQHVIDADRAAVAAGRRGPGLLVDPAVGVPA